MANRPIIDIDVKSEPFERFKRLFDQYVKDVGSVNAEWKALAANSNATLKPLAEYADRAAKAHNRLTIAIQRTHHAMSGLAKTGATFAKTVEHIAGTFAKWGSIGTGIGLFGIDRLANAVMERQRSAVGSGLTIGQQSSFAANMSPLLGSPASFLGAVANAKQDYSKWWALSAMGINPLAAQNQSTFDLGLSIEARARALWKQNPNLQIAQARGLTQFFSPEDLRRLGAMSDKDFAAAQAATRRDVNSLSFGSQATRDWMALSVQLHKAGLEIETVLVNGLAKLAPDLGKLSSAVTDALSAFLKSPEIKGDIESLASGIGDFAKFLASPQFKADVREFADDVGYMSRKIVDALKLLHLIPDKSADQSAVGPLASAAITGGAAVAGRVAGNAVAGPIGAVGGTILGAGFAAAGIASANALGKQVEGQIKKYGGFVDPETGNWIPLIQKMSQVESGGNPNAVSKKGAKGLMQLMPKTAQHYGVNPFDPAASLWVSKMEMARLYRKYGDISKAEAAYNWGEGNLDKDIAKYGSAWRSHLPKETQDYLRKLGGSSTTDDILRSILRVTKNTTRRPPPTITINNNTGAQVAIQAAGAAGN